MSSRLVGLVVVLLGLMGCSQPVVGVAADGGSDAFVVAADGGMPDALSSTDAAGTDAFPPDASGVDASIGADAGSDAGAADAGPPSCAWDAPFVSHTLVAGLSSPTECEYAPFLFDDERSVVVPRGCSHLGIDLYVATRTSLAAPFSGFVLVPASRTDHNDFHAFLSANQLDLYWQRVPTGGTSYDPVVSHRGSTAVAFTMDPVPIPNVAQAGNDGSPWIAPDGMYTACERGAGGLDIKLSPSDGAGGFLAGHYVVEINSDYVETAPILSADGLTIWLSTNRPDVTTGTDRDIVVAHRTSLTAPFGTPLLVPSLHVAGNEEPGWISPDNCRLYYSVEAPGATAADDVWVATRTPS